MKIPKGKTEQETIDIINSVIDKMVHKFVFGFYSKEDIRQEAFIIAIDGLERYDNVRPLENFLSVHISNRLKTFKRDNYYRLDKKCINEDCSNETLCDECQEKSYRVNIKKNIMEPIDIGNVNDENENSMSIDDNLLNSIMEEEIVRIIDRKMPIEYKIDYQKMLDGTYIQTTKKVKIEEIIKTILEESGYDDY